MEGCTTLIDVDSATWENKNGEPVLQGMVLLTLAASLPAVADGDSTGYSCEVRVDMGFKEPLTFNLQVPVQGMFQLTVATHSHKVFYAAYSMCKFVLILSFFFLMFDTA